MCGVYMCMWYVCVICIYVCVYVCDVYVCVCGVYVCVYKCVNMCVVCLCLCVWWVYACVVAIDGLLMFMQAALSGHSVLFKKSINRNLDGVHAGTGAWQLQVNVNMYI